MFGAVCPASGNSVGYVMPTTNTHCMNLFLSEMSKVLDDGVHAVVVMDRAGWHGSRELRIPANITIQPLPAYSPELNPSELIWLYLKSHYMSNRIYPDHNAIYQALCEAWRQIGDDADLIKSICKTSWIHTENLN